MESSYCQVNSITHDCIFRQTEILAYTWVSAILIHLLSLSPSLHSFFLLTSISRRSVFLLFHRVKQLYPVLAWPCLPSSSSVPPDSPVHCSQHLRLLPSDPWPLVAAYYSIYRHRCTLFSTVASRKMSWLVQSPNMCFCLSDTKTNAFFPLHFFSSQRLWWLEISFHWPHASTEQSSTCCR